MYICLEQGIWQPDGLKELTIFDSELSEPSGSDFMFIKGPFTVIGAVLVSLFVIIFVIVK